MKKKRGYHEKVIQKKMSGQSDNSRDQEPASGVAGNQPEVNNEDLEVGAFIDYGFSR